MRSRRLFRPAEGSVTDRICASRRRGGDHSVSVRVRSGGSASGDHSAEPSRGIPIPNPRVVAASGFVTYTRC